MEIKVLSVQVMDLLWMIWFEIGVHQGVMIRHRSEVLCHMCFIFLLKMSNNDRSMVIMILWNECMTIRFLECVLWLKWRNDLVIIDLYIGLSLRSRVHMQIYFWVVVHTFYKSVESICRCQAWEAHTYTDTLCKSHVYRLGFFNMKCWWCFISFAMFVVVCQSSLSHDNLCLKILLGLNFLWNRLLTSDDATVWWFIFGSMTCDGFSM